MREEILKLINTHCIDECVLNTACLGNECVIKKIENAIKTPEPHIKKPLILVIDYTVNGARKYIKENITDREVGMGVFEDDKYTYKAVSNTDGIKGYRPFKMIINEEFEIKDLGNRFLVLVNGDMNKISTFGTRTRKGDNE
jgi:hypothetical protein